ncbi:hypothetical protein [Clostridium sardiniense]|uniref:hypothetical protein n=1 Tax=Clostridium sardiniense TaxID=29369 RepID=UPI00195858A1|nr:hypothetical protein [Clostridium sardiniense]MBM7836524.1 hypothetical protein [Clostridium sardiniense]
MKKKLLALTLLCTTVFSTTAFAAAQSTSGTFNYKNCQAKGFLNLANNNVGEASTVKVAGTSKSNLHVQIYAKSKQGVTLGSKTNRSNPNDVYVQVYARGYDDDPLHVWQSQHSVVGPDDPYNYLTLFTK